MRKVWIAVADGRVLRALSGMGDRGEKEEEDEDGEGRSKSKLFLKGAGML